MAASLVLAGGANGEFNDGVTSTALIDARGSLGLLTGRRPPRVSGQIACLYMGDNQPVQAGQLLATIDDHDSRASLATPRRCRSLSVLSSPMP